MLFGEWIYVLCCLWCGNLWGTFLFRYHIKKWGTIASIKQFIHLASYLTRRTFLAFHGKYLGTTRAREQQARMQTRVTGLRKAVRFPEQRISYYYAYIATPRPPLLGAFSATNRSLPSLHPHLRTPMLKAPQALFIITRITHVLHQFTTPLIHGLPSASFIFNPIPPTLTTPLLRINQTSSRYL